MTPRGLKFENRVCGICVYVQNCRMRLVTEPLLVLMHSCKVEASLVHTSARPEESTILTPLFFPVLKQTPNAALATCSGSFGIAPEGECIA